MKWTVKPSYLLSLVMIAGASLIFGGTHAIAEQLPFYYDYEYSGATSPEGTSPWLTAIFDDKVDGIGPNTVRLTMSASGLTDAEFATEWYFNFDPGLEATSLTISPFNNSAPTPNFIGAGNDNYRAPGGGFYDILFGFPNSNNEFGERFTTGEEVIYDLTYISSISVNSFNFLSTPTNGNGTYLAAARVQGIGSDDGSGTVAPTNGGGSTPAPVPEPATMLLLGTGLIGLAGLGRKRLKS